MAKTGAATMNYVITRGKLIDQLEYSLFKLLDWHVGHAVCVIHRVETGWILINDCSEELAQRLLQKFGGTTLHAAWGVQGADISAVLREITLWIQEQ
jgi:hypothetical protein